MCVKTYQIQLDMLLYCISHYHLTKIISPPYDTASSHPHKTHKLQAGE